MFIKLLINNVQMKKLIKIPMRNEWGLMNRFLNAESE